MLQSTQSHVSELRRKHHSLETEIAEARRHPSVDETHLRALKSRKLRLKDQIWRLETAH